jgi:hypothetical protein
MHGGMSVDDPEDVAFTSRQQRRRGCALICPVCVSLAMRSSASALFRTGHWHRIELRNEDYQIRIGRLLRKWSELFMRAKYTSVLHEAKPGKLARTACRTF